MKKVTGMMIYYYHVCRRKLWYFSHNLNMEQNSESVAMGKFIDENSYDRKTKNILIDEFVNIDFLDEWKIVHEIKKSKTVEEASIWQTKYYMMILKEKGLEVEKGIIDYPIIKKRKIIELSDEDIDYLNEVIKDVELIISRDDVPELKKISICKKCAYYEYCYI